MTRNGGIRHHVRAFARSTRGAATALMGAAATIIAGGIAALSVEHIWLIHQRDLLQTATTSGGLAATVHMSQLGSDLVTLSDEELVNVLKPTARRYIEENLRVLGPTRHAKAMETLVLTVTPNRDTLVVAVSATADLGGLLVLPIFSGFFTVDINPIMNAGVEVQADRPPLEVVLALDVSRSMSGNHAGDRVADASRSRIATVKRAAKDLVGSVGLSAEHGVAVGLVPWASRVALSPTRHAAWVADGWLEYPRAKYFPFPYSCLFNPSCPARRPVVQALPATAPSVSLCMDEFRVTPPYAGDVNLRTARPVIEANDRMRVPSDLPFAQYFYQARGGLYRCFDSPLPSELHRQFCWEDPSSTPLAPPRQAKLSTWYTPDRDCGVGEFPPMESLSTDAQALTAAIDALSPVGHATYATLGVSWAHRMLLPSWKDTWGDSSFPASFSETRKAIVLLTDGEDNYLPCDRTGCEESRLGVGLPRACAEAKDAGIEIFVVAAMPARDIDTTFANRLRACSSEGGGVPGTEYVYINNGSSADLAGAFREIASDLTTIRRL